MTVQSSARTLQLFPLRAVVLAARGSQEGVLALRGRLAAGRARGKLSREPKTVVWKRKH